MDDYYENDYEVDVSMPETAIEELLGCVHVLFRISPDYKQIDDFMFSPCEKLDGIIPIDMIVDGEGIVLLEFLREIENEWREKKNGGKN